MKKYKIQFIPILIFMMFLATGLSQPTTISAAISTTNYDFGQVLVGSTQMYPFRIANLEDTSTTLTSLVFDNTNCSDFSVFAKPESMTIPPNGTIQIYVGFKPSTTGTCSDIMRIYADSPVPYSVNFTGTGIEVQSEEPQPSEEPQSSEGPQPVDESPSYLTQIEEIKLYLKTNIEEGHLKGAGKGRRAEKRLRVLNKMLVVTAHLMENGYFEAARKKLDVIYKKIDGKSRPRDFVKRGEAQEALALKIAQLTEQLSY
jgi:hypothetical protein